MNGSQTNMRDARGQDASRWTRTRGELETQRRINEFLTEFVSACTIIDAERWGDDFRPAGHCTILLDRQQALIANHIEVMRRLDEEIYSDAPKREPGE